MGVHVVHAALCVVLGDEKRGVLPERSGGEEGDDAAQGEVVVGDERGTVGIAICGARLGGVVAGQADDDERGDGAGGDTSRSAQAVRSKSEARVGKGLTFIGIFRQG